MNMQQRPARPHGLWPPVARWAAALAMLACSIGSANAAEFASSVVGTDFDFITAEDPSTFRELSFLGRRRAEMPDKSSDAGLFQQAFVFEARFDDPAKVRILVDVEIGNAEDAETEARRYVDTLGRLPAVLRTGVSRLVVHEGGEATTAFADEGLIVVYADNATKRIGTHDLEETIFHESVHAAWDGKYAGSVAWKRAQMADGRFVTAYARRRPALEDLAETALFAYTLLHHPDRLPEDVRRELLETIPHRIEFVAKLVPVDRPSKKASDEGPSAASRPKVWIYTDMSDKTLPGTNHVGTINDPDDHSAMAGYMLMANEFDTKGIVVTSTNRTEHARTPDQAKWASRTFGAAYEADVVQLNRRIGGYPTSIEFHQSCIKETAERFDPDRSYESLAKYDTVRALFDVLAAEEDGEVVNVLCWGSLTEPAILVAHCVATKRHDVLKRVRFIAHWTNSPMHQGTPEHPERVANCREDAAACAYLKRMAKAGRIVYHECGAIGQHGIVGGGPKGRAYFRQFESSRLGTLFANGKFARNAVDHSDSATYWVLLGEWGVSLDDVAADGTNSAKVERANQQRFHEWSKRIHDELLRRSGAAAGEDVRSPPRS